MDEATLLIRAQELREQYPAMFSHPECQLGEVWVGDVLVDIVPIQVSRYKKGGLSSARVGKAFQKAIELEGKTGRKEATILQHHGIFANLREYLSVVEAQAKKTGLA